MPKRDIISALNATPKGGSPQNGFDLSAFDDFHQKGGQFNVVSVRETAPKSFFRLGVDGFTRTQLCNTANFAHMKENFYFLFVPYALISRNAYQMLVDRKQPYTALEMGIEKFPTFDLETVLCRLVEIAHLDVSLEQNAYFRDVHGFNVAFGALRLFDMLGYGYFTDIVEATFSENVGHLTVSGAKAAFALLTHGKRPNANALAAYQCCWYHFFRNDIYDTDISARCFNFDDVTYSLDGTTFNYDILSVRNVDDFIVECCQLRYVPYKKDIFTGAMPGTQFGPVSSVEIDVDFADLSATFVGNSSSISGQVGNPSFEYDSVSTDSDLRRHRTNVYQGVKPSERDFYSTGLSAAPDPLNNRLIDGTTKLNAPGLGGDIDDLHDHNIPLDHLGHSHSFNASITPTGTVTLSGATSSTSLFDVLKLVEAQAIQKWRQKSMMAGNKTADQFRAHHGVVPRHLVDHLPDFIGSVDNVINVTEITSQADTASAADESNLGEIRGRGYGASDARTFDFECDDYGLLIVLHAIVPENTYSSFGIDMMHTKVVYTDFFQSEFQNIGLQFVPKYLLAPSAVGDNPQHPSQEGGNTFQSGGFGFVPRYFDYKQRVSKVHGLFNPTRLVYPNAQDGDVSVYGYADMQSFALVRKDLVQLATVANDNVVLRSFGMSLSNLYVNPHIFDSIFARESDDFQDTDQFFSHCRVICDASEPMSVLGLPQF